MSISHCYLIFGEVGCEVAGCSIDLKRVWRVSYFVVVIVGRGNVAFEDFGSDL